MLGTDLKRVQPYTALPPNCRFEVENAEDEWHYEEKFDFIHMRYMGYVMDFRRVFTSMFDNLSPGGWVECHEWILDVKAANMDIKKTNIGQWCILLDQGKPHTIMHLAPCPSTATGTDAVCKRELNKRRAQNRPQEARVEHPVLGGIPGTAARSGF